ncbi:MAG: hypothetical protein K0Q59_3342 [Paenibacillus sp.]|nr:hypothetical protein [Paenibacillus sp.]
MRVAVSTWTYVPLFGSIRAIFEVSRTYVPLIDRFRLNVLRFLVITDFLSANR